MGRLDIHASNMPIEMDRCLVNAMEHWKFPAPEGHGEVMVIYPFTFEPG